MTRALSLALLLSLLVFAAPASAHHHHHDWDGPDRGSNDWNPPQPEQQPQQQATPFQGWNPNQGDAPEDPRSWDGRDGQPGRTPQQWQPPQLPTVKGVTVGGKQAMLRTTGKAAIPRGAPARVRAIIRAANAIVGKPYKWGGGHGRLADSGYDCSGTVSYALIRSNLLSYPMVSGTFARWGKSGKGKYVTIYANRGHVYMEVAGLRLDTSAVGDYRGKSGVRWRPLIGKRVGFAVRHIGGL
jgi:hypothetical protein